MRICVTTLSLACCLLLVAVRSNCQAPPSDGTFVQVCTMQGESPQGASAFHKDEVCNLPGDFPLDRNYRQQLINATGGGATTDISASDIPGGLHLVVSGDHYWSIVKPIKMVILNQDGPLIRQFQVHLYCGPEPPPGPGCSVHVHVYARRKR
jgi:hypothetical protein